MTTKKLGLVLLASASILGSCHMNTGEVDSRLTKDLGVPVFFWAMPSDACAQMQFTEIANEYFKLDENQRADAGKLITQQFDAIVFQASEQSAPLTGTVKELRLAKQVCIADPKVHKDKVCMNHIQASKIILDNRPQTSFPATKVVKGKELTVTPEVAEDHSERIIYVTHNAKIFAAIKAGDEAALDAAVNTHGAEVASPEKAAPVCGKMAVLADLL